MLEGEPADRPLDIQRDGIGVSAERRLPEVLQTAQARFEGRRVALSREVGRLADDVEVVDRESLERRPTCRPHHAELELEAGWNWTRLRHAGPCLDGPALRLGKVVGSDGRLCNGNDVEVLDDTVDAEEHARRRDWNGRYRCRGTVEDRVDDRVKINRRLDFQGCGRVADDDLILGVDGEGKALDGVGGDAVGRSEGQGIGAGGALWGVPASVAVPLPLSANVTPPGKVPVSLRLGVGEPVVVTVKLPAAPTVKLVLSALVIAGAWLTVGSIRDTPEGKDLSRLGYC